MSMTRYYTLLIFLLIHIGIKYSPTVRADTPVAVVTEKQCVDGTLIQDNTGERCRCPLGWVHKSDTECVDSEKLVKCEGADSVDKPCGNYAKCVKVTDPPKDTPEYKCTCIENYTFLDTKRGNNFCIPTACKKKLCGWGQCVHIKGTEAICSCHANAERTTPTVKLSACDKEVDLTECKLKCPDDAKCVFDPSHGFYFCKPKKGDIFW